MSSLPDFHAGCGARSAAAGGGQPPKPCGVEHARGPCLLANAATMHSRSQPFFRPGPHVTAAADRLGGGCAPARLLTGPGHWGVGSKHRRVSQSRAPPGRPQGKRNACSSCSAALLVQGPHTACAAQGCRAARHCRASDGVRPRSCGCASQRQLTTQMQRARAARLKAPVHHSEVLRTTCLGDTIAAILDI